MSESNDKISRTCWNQAIHSYGTAYIFEKRITKYNRQLNIVKFVGIGTPLFIGAFVLAEGSEFKYLNVLIAVASIVLIFQLITSFWALVTKWEEKYSHAVESTFANYDLAWEYEKLAQNHLLDEDQRKNEFRIIEAKSREWDRKDYKQEVSEKEKRKGMRAALRNYQRSCSGCGEIPKSMNSTECDICGNF